MKRVLPLYVMVIMIGLSNSAWSQGGFRFAHKLRQPHRGTTPVTTASPISQYQNQTSAAVPTGETHLANAKFPQVRHTFSRVARVRPRHRDEVSATPSNQTAQRPIVTPFHYPAGVGPVMTNIPRPTSNPSFDVDRSMSDVDVFAFPESTDDFLNVSDCPLVEQAAAQSFGQAYEAERSRIAQLLPPPTPERVQKIVPQFSTQTEGIVLAKPSHFFQKSDHVLVKPIIILQEEYEEPIAAPNAKAPSLPLKIEGPIMPESQPPAPERMVGIVDWQNDDQDDASEEPTDEPIFETGNDPFDELFDDDNNPFQ